MIRRFAIAALMLTIVPPAFAQGIGSGVKGGVGIASQRTESDEGDPAMHVRVGVVAGAFATLPLTSWLDLDPEVLYASRGARLELEGVKASVALDYLDIPVMARVRLKHTGTTHYYAAAGPFVAYLLRARSRTDFGRSTEEIDITDQVEALDYGVAAGGGTERGRLVIDARFTLGLKDVDKDTSDSARTRNRALSLTVGYRF